MIFDKLRKGITVINIDDFNDNNSPALIPFTREWQMAQTNYIHDMMLHEHKTSGWFLDLMFLKYGRENTEWQLEHVYNGNIEKASYEFRHFGYMNQNDKWPR